MEEFSRTALYRRISALEQALLDLEVKREAEAKDASNMIETLKMKTERDKLTGLANADLLEQRTSARGGFFILADLDGFKGAQDAHPEGHSYGDRILREFADFLVTITRTGRGRAADRVTARLHGDEFVVWCPTRHGARRIKHLIRMWRSLDGAVGASAGLGRDIDSADANMYADKERRRASRTCNTYRKAS